MKSHYTLKHVLQMNSVIPSFFWLFILFEKYFWTWLKGTLKGSFQIPSTLKRKEYPAHSVVLTWTSVHLPSPSVGHNYLMMTQREREHRTWKRKASKGKHAKFNDMQHNKGRKIELNNWIRQGWRDGYCSVHVSVCSTAGCIWLFVCIIMHGVGIVHVFVLVCMTDRIWESIALFRVNLRNNSPRRCPREPTREEKFGGGGGGRQAKKNKGKGVKGRAHKRRQRENKERGKGKKC